MPASVYSLVTDMLNGNIPFPASLNKQKFVDDAADEIDSVIGTKYVTPINMNDLGPVSRPSRLLLKRISVWLSTGRSILAVAGGGEDVQLHAYGLKLVNDATLALQAIGNGEVLLDGATTITDPDNASAGLRRAPVIANVDPVSNVEAFMEYFNPNTYVIDTRQAGG